VFGTAAIDKNAPSLHKSRKQVFVAVRYLANRHVNFTCSVLHGRYQVRGTRRSFQFTFGVQRCEPKTTSETFALRGGLCVQTNFGIAYLSGLYIAVQTQWSREI
jgi:hypothetical protein